MTWDLEHLKFRSLEIALTRFLDEKIGRNRFNFKAEAEIAERIGLGNHRRSIAVETDQAVKFPPNFCNVADMINVPVGEE